MKQIKKTGSWAETLKQQFGINESTRLAWMTQYAAKHEAYDRSNMKSNMLSESLAPGMNQTPVNYGSNLAATPGNTMGMGNFGAPIMMNGGNAGYNSTINQFPGSGDPVSQSNLPLALQTLGATVGLDLVGVVNATTHTQSVTYLDFPYAGGKFGRSNEIATLDGIGKGVMDKPSYVKVILDAFTKIADAPSEAKEADEQAGTPALKEGELYKKGDVIMDTDKIADSAVETENVKLADFINSILPVKDANGAVDGIKFYDLIIDGTTGKLSVKVADNKIYPEADGYTYGVKSGDAIDNSKTTTEGAIVRVLKTTRQGGSIIAKTVQVTKKNTANVLVDDSFGQVALAINKKRIDAKEPVVNVFDLVATGDQRIAGYTSFADEFVETKQGFGRRPMSRAENETGTGNVIGARYFSKWIEMSSSEIVGQVTRQQVQDMKVYGIDICGRVLDQMANELSQEINNEILTHLWAMGELNHNNLCNYKNVCLDLDLTAPAKESTKEIEYMTDYMTYADKQRRVQTRVLAAKNLVTVTSRCGRPDWILTNVTVATALQDSAQYRPIENTLTSDSDMYLCGTFAGLQLYVDPQMDINANEVLIGRRTDGTRPGVIFMPYILCETVSIIAEGTMSNKMLMNSRYAVAEIGFYPEQQYYAFRITGNLL